MRRLGPWDLLRLEFVVQPAQTRIGGGRTFRLEEEHELVTAPPEQEIVGADAGAQGLGKRQQSGVARGMPEAIVQGL